MLGVALGCAALVPAAGASADASCPDARPCIVVTWTGTASGSQTVTVDDLAAWADLTNPPYRTRVVPGTGAQDEPRPGQALSIRHLLGQLSPPIAAGSVTFTEAPHRSSAPSTLTTADLGDPTDPVYPFQDGLMPAVFVIGGNDAIGYIRPLRGDADTNGDDFWQTDSGGALHLTVHTSGRLLSPRLTAAKATVAPGESTTFTATGPGDPGTALTYTWSYGDGSTDTTSMPTVGHAYSTPGTYLAAVTVRGADGSYGQSPAVRITVGARPTASSTTGRPGTGTNPNPNNPSTGPRSGGGHRGGAKPSPTATAAATGSPAPVATSKGTPAAQPTDTATASATASSRPDAPPAAGTEVAGILLVGVHTATDGQAAPDTAPAARRGGDGPSSVNPELAAIPVTLLLLAAGAAREGRWLRRRRRGRDRKAALQ